MPLPVPVRRVLALVPLVLIAGLAPIWVAPSPAHAAGGSTVVSNDYAWNWNPDDQSQPGSLFSDPRSVTVDQTSDLVSQVVHVSWKNFSPSNTQVVQDQTFFPLRVFECDTASPVSPASCFGTQTFGSTHPGVGSVPTQSNFQSAVTSKDGSGGIDFTILTGADNDALGCSPSHDCSLVVEPWTGGDYYADPTGGHGGINDPPLGVGTTPICGYHNLDTQLDPDTYVGNYGSPNGYTQFWEMSCNWQQRITVPLHFSPSPENCPNRDADFRTEGSPLLRRAMDEWRAGICQSGTAGTGLTVSYAGVSESQARSDFDRGGTDLGLTSQPSDSSGRAFTYAPLTTSDIAVAYYVDNQQTGKPITDLKLSPRLLAKMLTQSYSEGLEGSCPSSGQLPCAPEVSGNPTTIFSDPDFLTLNSDHSPFDFPQPPGYGASYPDIVFGQSDSTYALTRWIASDPDAESFLRGKPDPWGMTVNTAYLPTKSPSYPVDQISANDSGSTKQVDQCGTVGSEVDENNQPIYYKCTSLGLQTSWSPINGLNNVARQLLSGKSTATASLPSCSTDSLPVQGVCTHFPSLDVERVGQRALFAVVAGGDVGADKFPTAQLETRTDSDKFVSLNTASLSAAVSHMVPNADKVTSTLPTDGNPDAYPLTMVTYGMVPVCGLSADKAQAMSAFLNYIASDAGNQYGVQPGDLAPGYLALNDTQRAQTASAATVAAGATATCDAGEGPVPSSSSSDAPSPSSSGGAPSGGPGVSGGAPGAPSPGGSTGNGDGAYPGGNGSGGSNDADGQRGSDSDGGGSNGTGPGNSGSGHAGSNGTDGTGSEDGSSLAPAAYHRPPADSTGLAGSVLPIVLIVGAVLLLAGPGVMFLSRTPAGAQVMRRARDLFGRF